MLRERDPAYGLVLVWAYAGIVVKESSVVPVAVIAAGGAVWIGLLVARTIARRRGSAPA